MKPLNFLECVHSCEDHRFDLVYPPEVRALSRVHWTPVMVARAAAEFLAGEPGTRVLDIGCGPGKFCVAAAVATEGSFTGVEQRMGLCEMARWVIRRANLPNARIIHGDATEVDFSNFDAFYLYNPFEENLDANFKIDTTVRLSTDIYEKYTGQVARQLAAAPLGTRVATFGGSCEEVPMGYEYAQSTVDHRLKFWKKTNDFTRDGS
jgi:SAM-dependent methyltransferase